MILVYSDPKTGKSAQLSIDAAKVPTLLNVRIGEELDGSEFGLAGYKLKVTGGMDTSGFPLTRGIQGSIKTKVLKRKGSFEGKRRNTVRGGSIAADTAQINAVITEYGTKPASELFPEKQKAGEQ